jgi:hypothetical protein
MKRTSTAPGHAWDHVNLAAELADLKEQHYRLLLAVGALADALEARGLVKPGELEERAARLDREAEASLRAARATRSRAASRRPRA